MAAARTKGTGDNDKLISNKPKDLERRIFVGNLPTFQMTPKELEEMFSKYGKIVAHNMLRGFGFVQFDRPEDAQAAVEGENGRLIKGHKLDVNMAAERRNTTKAPARSSPPARRAPNAFGDGRDARRDRSPLRSSPRRDARDNRAGREVRDLRGDPRDLRGDPRDLRGDPRDVRDLRGDPRDVRDLRDPRDLMDPRDIRDMRNLQSLRNPLDMRDLQDLRDPLFDRYRDLREPPLDPLYRREEAFDRLLRYEELYRRKEDPFMDRYRDPPMSAEERLKREERRREELYRKYFEEIQRRFESERPVDCSVVVVVNKQANPGVVREYAEVVGRKVRDLGMVVDLIFLNTEASLTQALEDVSRAGSPFAIVITQQHQVHRSCTVNILFGTPQEHRNMPLADAVVLVARSYERCKLELREKEREDIARQAAKMADDIILQERDRDRLSLTDGGRGAHPPAIQSLLNLLIENRYLTVDELDKIINYLMEKKERIRGPSDPLQSQLSRQALGAPSIRPLDSQSSLSASQPLQNSQPMSQAMAHAMSQVLANPPPANPPPSNPQQELQAKILSLFNSGAGSSAAKGTSNLATGTSASTENQNYGTGNQTRSAPIGATGLGQAQQITQAPSNQHSGLAGQGGGLRATGPRPGVPSQSTPQNQSQYGQPQSRASGNIQQSSSSSGINFDNPSVQKALDTLIQSGPALSHLVNQTTAQVGRAGPPMGQQSMGGYQRNF
ncbi:nuclear receptor coactivator 5 isoform X1 [Pleurodeles waltl]